MIDILCCMPLCERVNTPCQMFVCYIVDCCDKWRRLRSTRPSFSFPGSPMRDRKHCTTSPPCLRTIFEMVGEKFFLFPRAGTS